MLISWGTTGHITEITPEGRLALRLRLGRWTYRAFRAPWTGLPPGRPAVKASRRQGALTVWASWNGATEVKHWSLLAAAPRRALSPVGPPVAFADLETRIRVRSPARSVAVRALDARGRTLGQSTIVRVR